MATAKEKVTSKAQKAKEVLKETEAKTAKKSKEIKQHLSDTSTANKIEAKKTAAKAKQAAKAGTAKAKSAATAAKKSASKMKAAKLDIIFESAMGGQITPEDIAKMVPAGTTAAYVKLEDNKIYWIKGDENGSVDIW